MKVFFIDPGDKQSAYAIWTGVQVQSEILPNDEMLAFARREAPRCEICAIEMIASYGMPVGREVFETCVWIGRFRESMSIVRKWAGYSPYLPELVFRMDIKMHHCRSPGARDSNIRQALLDKYGPQGTKKAPGTTYGLAKDKWAAFAGATYLFETM